MANRFPLIFNSGAGQIQELAASDNLDLTSSNLVNAGILFTSSGSATAPSMSIGSGTTYPPGLYSPGTDQVAVATNGTGKVFIDANGNIGLGITPVANTFIGGARGSATPSLIELAGNGNTVGSTGFVFGQDSSGVGILFQRSNAAMAFSTNGTERARIRSDGTFEIKGAGTVAISPGFSVNPSTPANSFVIDSSGRLGIGISSPTQLLHVQKDQAAATFARIDNQTNNSSAYAGVQLGAYGNTWGLAIGSSSANSNSLVFVLDPNTSITGGEKMRLDSSGRLGIGTSSVNAKIQIEGSDAAPAASGNMNSGIVYQSGAGARAINIGVDNTNNFAWINSAYTNNSGTATDTGLRLMVGATSAIAIDSSRRVGIGTTTVSSKLHVIGDEIRFSNSSNVSFYGTITHDATGAGANIYNSQDTGPSHIFQRQGTEQMRLDASSRLLIGTSTAAQTAGTTSAVQIFRNNLSELLNLHLGFNGATAGARINLSRSRNTTHGSYTILQNGDEIGGITFVGDDGVDYDAQAARIYAEVDGTPGANDMPGRLVFSTTADGSSSPTERMRIDNAGNLTVNDTGGTQYSAKVYVNGSIAARNGGADGAYQNAFVIGYTANFNEKNIIKTAVAASAAGSGFQFMVSNGAGSASVTESFRINRESCAVIGSLSKGSGSFKISHPLPEKTDTHYLVHSFIEGPQADLIYRGHVALVDGTAQVNIDEAGRMTEGTFEALCTNVCCFTSNETDWTPVRGHVDGNILSIEAQDPTSTAEVCWMVIGERKDQHMLDTDWTDENGKVITEPLKEVKEVTVSEAQ